MMKKLRCSITNGTSTSPTIHGTRRSHRGYGPGSRGGGGGGYGGPEGGATWNPGPSAVTRAADLGVGGHYTTKGRPTGARDADGARAVPRIFTEVRPRDGGLDRQKDVGSLVDMLVDPIARMQLDLADIRAENRMLRTPGVPRTCPSTGSQRRRKCHDLMEQLVGNNANRFSTLLCVRMAGTMIQRHCSCSHIWRGMHCTWLF